VIYSLVKTATDARSAVTLAREAQWLRELEAVPELEGQVPRVLEEGLDAEGRHFLRVSVAPAQGETRAFTSDHARFLANLGKARFRAADFEVSGSCRWLQKSLQECAGVLPAGELATLSGAYRDCETALLYWTGPYVLSQGDFAPWNIRTFGAQLFVFDWGQARAEASPLDDVLHYLMIQRTLRPGPISARYLQAAMKRAHGFALEAYPEWRWRPRVIGALTLVYLLGVILHYAREGRAHGEVPVFDSYWRLVENRSRWLPHS
jgi:hypothetical protein